MTKSSTFKVENPTYTHVFPEPFTVLGEQVTELPIRKPNGLDMIEVGTPVIYDSATGKAELDIPKCYEMVSRLSAMPTKILLSVDTGEMLDLFWMVASFFMRGRQALLPALEKQKAELLARADSREPSPEGSIQGSL